MGDHKVKSGKMKKKELQNKKFFRGQQVEAPKPIVHEMKVKVRNVAKAIEDIFDGTCDFRFCEHKFVSLKNHIGPNSSPELKRILLHFHAQKVDFFGEGIRNARVPITALINLSKNVGKSLRKIEDWKAPSHNTHRCISHFARHLYAKYHVPAFMDEAWYFNDIKYTTYREWFIHIGQGQNIRTAQGLPVPLTKREAHFFLEAPKDFSPMHAIRYGQIINMGGNENFVRQILKTRIANDFDEVRDKFWMSIFNWFMANPMLDACHYAPILDYIHNQKYVPYRLNEGGEMVPRQPNFSMKGRDPETLLRQVEVWHRQTGKEGRMSIPSWEPSGINGFYLKREEAVHTIREICTQRELIEEGRKMHHCVSSYVGSCAKGTISIWSYEVMDVNGKHRALTLEVDNKDRILRQARGKYNEMPTVSQMHFIKMWVREVKLSVSKYLI